MTVCPGARESIDQSAGEKTAGTAELPADRALRADELKLLSLLLQYPDASLAALQPDFESFVTALPDSLYRQCLSAFLGRWQSTGMLAMQQEYVHTFDFQKRVSLYLSYYQYGDHRRRGVALLRLKRAYAAAGLPLHEGEIPDYLPALLEFAALAPPGYGDRLLRDFRPAIELLRLGLAEGSPYAWLLDAVCSVVAPLTTADEATVQALLAEGPPTEEVGVEPFAPPDVMPAPGSGRQR